MVMIVVALMAASIGACLGFFACAICVIAKHESEERKVFDNHNDPS